ncbi:endonuclease domain-containing protein [Litorimonas sp. WD9-15]|uniref:endonuclease domain-containing protein n=1 Tax=Litorimonas sp. WD9-15 TaxID=3418716 RepID=UPI003D02C2C0
MKNATAKTHKRAKTHRRALTAAENILWQEIRRKQIHGYHFRRQVPIGPYITDFACVKEKLIIEVDGIGHAEPDEISRDEKRTAYLEQLGWHVVRFQNIDVFDHIDAVVEQIWHHLKQSEPLHA